MSSIQQLHERINKLSELASLTFDIVEAHSRARVIDDGKFMALYSIASDLANRSGIDHLALAKHYSARLRFWQDYFLREAEKASPLTAALLDQRTLEQVCVQEGYPSIFDPPPADSP